MRKTALALLSGAALLLAGSAFAREVKIGTDCTNPPFNYRTASGELAGFDVDIAREIGKREGFDLKFVCQSLDGALPALTARKFDLILASLSITEARQKSIDFSIPYRSSTGRFVGPKSSTLAPVTAEGQPNPKALDGKVVGLIRSSTYDRYFTELFPGVQISRYENYETLLLDLVSGRVDLIMAGPIKMEGFFEDAQGKNFKYIGPELENIKYFGPGVGVGLRKNEPELLDKVNNALKGMFADGTFKAINQKYWKFTVLPSVWTQ
ncbi:transporter substrate-binding domain-containing protein [Bosea sp. 2KB_26]|uniref:transporter substrate-binding domain-containing protein n=1 Tax=Bosea sp. 2KB_26 TaxID=3237475 RepID=UPI000DE38369